MYSACETEFRNSSNNLCLICSEPAPAPMPVSKPIKTSLQATGNIYITFFKVIGLPPNHHDSETFQNSAYCNPCLEQLSELHRIVQQITKLEQRLSKLKADIEQSIQNEVIHASVRPLQRTSTGTAQATVQLRNKLREGNKSKLTKYLCYGVCIMHAGFTNVVILYVLAPIL